MRNAILGPRESLESIASLRTFVCALLLAIFGVFPFVARGRGQNGALPLRSESRNVVVPVLVLDKKRVDHLRDMRGASKLTEAGNPLLSAAGVSDLTIQDFHILDDGKEQKIESLTTQPDSGWAVSAGIGKWVWTDPVNSVSRGVIGPPRWLAYLLTYEQPASPPGSCHQITVTVDRPDSLIYTRGGYCNLGNSAADPLGGTKLGEQMESDLKSRKQGPMTLSVTSFSSFGRTQEPLTNFVIEYPENPPKVYECDDPPTIEILGILDASNGIETEALRFSDLVNLGFWSFLGQTIRAFPEQPPPGSAGVGCAALTIPYQYETQVQLAPGDYILRVAVKDGKKFGEAETPISVGPPTSEPLAIGDVVLSRRYRQVPDQPQVDTKMLPGVYVPLVSKGVEIVPTADPRFKRSDLFAFYFEIYAPEEESVGPVQIQAHLRIRDAKTGQVLKELMPLDAAPYVTPGNPVIPIGRAMNISALPSGFYRLEVQATDSAGNSTVWRPVDFSIE